MRCAGWEIDWDRRATGIFCIIDSSSLMPEKRGNDEAVRQLGQAIAGSRRLAHARATEALYSPRYTALMLALVGGSSPGGGRRTRIRRRWPWQRVRWRV